MALIKYGKHIGKLHPQ